MTTILKPIFIDEEIKSVLEMAKGAKKFSSVSKALLYFLEDSDRYTKMKDALNSINKD